MVPKSAFGLMILIAATVMGCSAEPDALGPRYGTAPVRSQVVVYHLAVHPLHNPSKLIRTYQPLMHYLNSRLDGIRLEIESSRDYSAFEEKIASRKPEFILPNPFQTIMAFEARYHVIAAVGDPDEFKGIFIVRKDSTIREPSDLIGKSVSYPSQTALAACIMPQYFLHRNGVDVRKDVENRYVGSQESAIMNVYLGKTAAGATWPVPWRTFQKEHPYEARHLMVIWETPSLINNSFMARDDVPIKSRDRIASLLFGLNETPEGQKILKEVGISRFHPAGDSDYEPIRQYISDFEKEVRPIH